MKTMMSESNVHTMSTMENKDGSYTVISEHTALPHMNSNVTAKVGPLLCLQTFAPPGWRGGESYEALSYDTLLDSEE